jgi:hypothetical protein
VWVALVMVSLSNHWPIVMVSLSNYYISDEVFNKLRLATTTGKTELCHGEPVEPFAKRTGFDTLDRHRVVVSRVEPFINCI